MSDERKVFPRAVVDEVFRELWSALDPQPAWAFDGKGRPACCPHAQAERVCAVGGYRRGKKEMKDLELLYIPRIAQRADAGDLFGGEIAVDVTEQLWTRLLEAGFLAKRLAKTGAVSAWGAENKHAVHVATGLPIDLFAATAENWVNRLVVTTGPRESNVRVAAAVRALARPLEWEVYDAGFVPLGTTWAKAAARDRLFVRSEADVFRIAGLPFLPPEAR